MPNTRGPAAHAAWQRSACALPHVFSLRWQLGQRPQLTVGDRQALPAAMGGSWRRCSASSSATEPKRVARYLAKLGEPIDVPPRSSSAEAE